jgi:NADPH-dependent 2,4-dienoyl-CoA reductase/sulfur reductase-like enzyme
MSTTTSAGRRRFVQQASAGAVALASVGCASLTQPQGPRVVVVGGGWGGASTARALVESGHSFNVTLVEPNPRFMSCPLSAHYITGHAIAESFQMGYEALTRAGVIHVRERVTAIDRARKVVAVGSRELPYDFLVLAPGVEYMEEALPGYAQAREQLPVGFRAFEQAAVKAQFDAFLATGGNLVITVPKPPYRCPPAPYERAALMAEVMQQRRIKGKVIVLDENPNPMPPPIAKPILDSFAELYKDQIERVAGVELRGIDAQKKVIATSRGDVPYQMANVVLPMRAPALIRQAQLGQRWADVKLPYFTTAADESVYVIGDSVGLPLPKSGHVAFETGQSVARHIALRTQPAAGSPPAPTMPNGICWAYMSQKEAIGIHVSTKWTPGAAPTLQFKVDPARSAAAGEGATQWGRSVWNAMLG